MKKRINLIFLAVFSFILITNLVSAAPPVTTVEQFAQGYIVEESQQSYVLVNEPYTYHFFLYNYSTGKSVSNTSANCMFFMANITGTLLIMENATYFPSGGYWGVEIPASAFTYEGEYSYGVKCQDGVGGALAGTFNAVNVDWDVQESLVTFAILLILVILLGFCISNIFQNDNVAWKLGFLSTAYIILMGLTYSLLSISRLVLFHIPAFEIIFNTLWIVLVPGFFVYVLGIVIYLIFTALKEKEIKSFVARGFSEEEARSKMRDK